MDTQYRYTATTLGLVLEEQGRSKRWLARRVGVSESLIGKVVYGERSLKECKARAVADALGMPFSMLFELRTGSESLPDEERNASPLAPPPAALMQMQRERVPA